MIETDIVRLFVLRVSRDLPDARAFIRTIVDRVVEIEGRKVRLISGIPGQGDVDVFLRGGRRIEVEAKAARGKMREAQERWQAFCHDFAIPHLVVRARKGEAPEETVTRWVAELRDLVESVR